MLLFLAKFTVVIIFVVTIPAHHYNILRPGVVLRVHAFWYQVSGIITGLSANDTGSREILFYFGYLPVCSGLFKAYFSHCVLSGGNLRKVLSNIPGDLSLFLRWRPRLLYRQYDESPIRSFYHSAGNGAYHAALPFFLPLPTPDSFVGSSGNCSVSPSCFSVSFSSCSS